MPGTALKQDITDKAIQIGFDKVGFVRVRLEDEDAHLNEWLNRGYHGEMQWMEHLPERRTNAALSLPGAQTIVCCALNYYQGPPESRPLDGVISSYARGVDYHRVLKEKLSALARFIEDIGKR